MRDGTSGSLELAVSRNAALDLWMPSSRVCGLMARGAEFCFSVSLDAGSPGFDVCEAVSLGCGAHGTMVPVQFDSWEVCFHRFDLVCAVTMSWISLSLVCVILWFHTVLVLCWTAWLHIFQVREIYWLVRSEPIWCTGLLLWRILDFGNSCHDICLLLMVLIVNKGCSASSAGLI